MEIYKFISGKTTFKVQVYQDTSEAWRREYLVKIEILISQSTSLFKKLYTINHNFDDFTIKAKIKMLEGFLEKSGFENFKLEVNNG